MIKHERITYERLRRGQFEGFLKALDELCKAYRVRIAPQQDHQYDRISVSLSETPGFSPGDFENEDAE